MRFTQIVAPTVKELFIQRMESLILSGELPIGAALPSEREMAEQMGISKTAVHTGVADMERKGFLRVVPRQGIFVNDYARYGTLEVLASIMQHDGGGLDSRNVRSMIEMREAIESVALKRTIEKRDPAVTAGLEAMVAEAWQLVGTAPIDYMQLGELYFRFHHTICVASGNTIAPLILNAFRGPSITFWSNSARSLGPEESVGRLERFARLIAEGDAEGACAHLRQITESSEQVVR